jgi:AcrR family transcriptional regulator
MKPKENLPEKKKEAENDLESYGLTTSQTRLLEVLRDPKSMLFTAEQISKQANITRGTYYNSFKSEAFVRALDAEMAAYRSMNDFAVMHNIVAQAKQSGNHQLITLFEKLQNRLKEGGERPAQIILVFNNVERPAELNNLRVIEGEIVKDANTDSLQTTSKR